MRPGSGSPPRRRRQPITYHILYPVILHIRAAQPRTAEGISGGSPVTFRLSFSSSPTRPHSSTRNRAVPPTRARKARLRQRPISFGRLALEPNPAAHHTRPFTPRRRSSWRQSRRDLRPRYDTWGPHIVLLPQICVYDTTPCESCRFYIPCHAWRLYLRRARDVYVAPEP
jgi:hypothetical protein